MKKNETKTEFEKLFPELNMMEIQNRIIEDLVAKERIMKRVYKKLVFGLLMLFAAAVIFASMTVPYNGLMWILKAILFWVLVQWGFVTVDKCNTKITKQMTDDETYNKNKE